MRELMRKILNKKRMNILSCIMLSMALHKACSATPHGVNSVAIPNNDTLRLFNKWEMIKKVIPKENGKTEEVCFVYHKYKVKVSHLTYYDSLAVAGPYSHKNRTISIGKHQLHVDSIYFSRFKYDLSTDLYFPPQDIIVSTKGGDKIFKIRLAQDGCIGDFCHEYVLIEIKFNNKKAWINDLKSEYYNDSLKIK